MTRRKNIFCYMMIAPTLILSIVLGIYPMIESMRMAFLDYNLMTKATQGTPFIGLGNYQAIFRDPTFVQAFYNTFLFVIIVVPAVVALGLLVAQALHTDFPGRGIIRSLALIPWFIPTVVASSIWLVMFQPERSPINQILMSIGLIQNNLRFLTDATPILGPISLPMLSLSIVRVWGGLSFTVLMILAGLQSISAEIYEAADIDGANLATKFFYLTLPMLRPVLAILITLLVIGGVGHFEISYIMTGGGPQNMTNILAVMAYKEAFSFYRFGTAAAISSVILVFTGAIAVFYIREKVKTS
jgi:multiple sugar transport system permease protein